MPWVHEKTESTAENHEHNGKYFYIFKYIYDLLLVSLFDIASTYANISIANNKNGSLLFILCSCEYHVSAAEARTVRNEIRKYAMKRHIHTYIDTRRAGPLSKRANNGKIIPCSNKCAIENNRLFFIH